MTVRVGKDFDAGGFLVRICPYLRLLSGPSNLFQTKTLLRVHIHVLL